MDGPHAETQDKSRQDRAAMDSASLKPKQRSAITNGRRLLNGVDGRNPWVRRCRDIISDLVNDRGGFDMVTAAELNLIRRASTLTTELEILEAKFATAGKATPTDLDLYTRSTGNLRRLLETIGLDRRARPVESIDNILKRLDAEQPAPVDVEAAE
jgi:hypothetical protein